jgi:GNAT superfamily N-acetyltransferase
MPVDVPVVGRGESMNLINDSSWSLRLEPSGVIPLTFDEPEDFIHEICGKILRGENHCKRNQIAGLFRIYYADFELGQNHNVRAHEILDTYQHTFDYADAVLDSDGAPFSRRLHNLLGNEIENFNFLILDRVELLPKYRGNGVGLLVLRSLIERFGAGVGVVGMKPFPLQLESKDATDSRWRRRLRLEQFPSDSEISARKLRNYYHRLGFVRMRSTPFMFRSLSWTLPTIEQLYAEVRR